MRLPAGLVSSVTTLTVLRVQRSSDGRGGAVAGVLPWAPVVGGGLGLAVAVVVLLGSALLDGATGALLTAAAAIALLAWSTRGFHLDGLADTADGLGAMGSRDRSLDVMRRSDIGPFGVASLALVLLLQVAALGHSIVAGQGVAVVLVSVVTGRLAMARAGLPNVPAARPDGLGAQVVGTVSPRLLLAQVGALVLLSVGVTLVLGDAELALHLGLGVAGGLGTAELLLRRVRRRLGGVSGDVYGALGEVATTGALVAAALGAGP